MGSKSGCPTAGSGLKSNRRLSGRDRLSLVVAYDPNFETLVDPRAFCSEEEAPCDEPITCGDYLLWRFGKAFSYRRRDEGVSLASAD